MNKREFALLEKAYEAEVTAALNKSKLPGILQTKSKLVDKLVADGLLQRVQFTVGGQFPVRVSGYELTHAGRFFYCGTCEGEK